MKKVKFQYVFAVFLLVAASPFLFAGGAQESASDDGEIVITFEEHVVEPYPFLYGVIEEFERQNPNVKIDLQGIDTDTHKQNIMMAAQANNLPDIFWIDEDLMARLAEEDLLLGLKDYLIQEGVDENMSPDMFYHAQIDGEIYGLPSERLITGYWINKQYFEEYDLSLPETFQDLLTAAKVFSSHDVITISNGARSPFSEWSFEAMIGRYGFFEHWEDIVKGGDTFTNPNFIRFYERVEQLADAGAFNPSVATTDYSQAMEVFKGGRSAMVDSGAWLAGELESLPFADDIEFWFGPTFSDGVGDQYVATMVGGGPYSVSSKVAENPAKLEAVIDFFAFLYGEEGARIIADDYNALPVSYYEGEPNTEETPAFASLIESLNDPKWKSLENQPSNVMNSAVQTAFYDSVYGVINGVYTPMEAAQTVQDAIEISM